MAETYDLRASYDALTEDAWRRQSKFSDDMMVAQGVLFNSYATRADYETQLLNWFQANQPCLFGRITAAKKHLHFCFIRDADIQRKNDQQIAQIIDDSLIQWKRRSFEPKPSRSSPAHGFVLAVCSSRVANATPNAALKSFSEKLRDLWGCPAAPTEVGAIHQETLYLRKPETTTQVRFKFNIDFFAAQGDGRWWHDHRAPGGILFTANSIGHMARYREWYDKKPDQSEWILQNAMLTISLAAPTKFGAATWLKPLEGGKPFVDLKCPFAKPERLKAELTSKDWTRYGGYLHTDHSIRPEFFTSETDEPAGDTLATEFLQDFTYLYDDREDDNLQFVQGVPASLQEVEDELGAVRDWPRLVRKPDSFKRGGGADFFEGSGGGMDAQSAKAIAERAQIKILLKQGEAWRLPASDIKELE